MAVGSDMDLRKPFCFRGPNIDLSLGSSSSSEEVSGMTVLECARGARFFAGAGAGLDGSCGAEIWICSGDGDGGVGLRGCFFDWLDGV